MKKRSLFQINSNYLRHYNRFKRLYFRIRTLISQGLFFHLSLFERKRLLRRFRLFYKRLLRFQSDLGIRFAGATLAFTLICSVASSQGKFIERTGEDNPLGGKINPFASLSMGEKIAPAFVDIDNDGDDDLFVGDTLGFIKYYENTGNNVYEQPLPAENPFNGIDLGDETKPAFVDIDDDGDFDAFIGVYEGILHYYRNDGTAEDPSFSAVTGPENPFDGVDVGAYSAPAFVDIDNDGDFDSFIGNKYDFIKYYENTTDGGNITFVERTGLDNPVDSIGGIFSVISFADIDNDGDFDFFMGQKYGSLRQFENTGNAGNAEFEEKEEFNNIFFDEAMGYNLTPSFIDFDGDSDFDALIGNAEGNINYYNNEGSQGEPEFIMYQPIDVGYLAEPALVDIDNDGDLDTFIGEYFGTISYYKNDGNDENPNYHRAKGINNPFYGDTLELWPKPSFVDIDNNNSYDAFFGLMDGTIKYFVNNGSQEVPVFFEQTGINNPFNNVDIGSRAKLAFVDIDNDTDKDVFIGCSDGTIKYFENTSEGLNITFVEQTGANNPFDGIDLGSSTDPYFCDLDYDEDFDAIIGSYAGTNDVNYFLNAGNAENPTFNEMTGSQNPFSTISLQYPAPFLVDIDNDSDLDLFVGERFGTVKYYEHNYPPVVANEIPTQNPLVNQPFNFTIPENTFYDHDAGDMLTYSSTLSDGNPLPGWLNFNPNTREYSGTATIAGTLNIKVNVIDMASHTASEIFDLVVTENPLGTDIQTTEQISIYPVPASNFLNIQLEDIDAGSVDIEILDISGRIIFIKTFNNINRNFFTRIDVSNLSEGIYYINIRRGNSIINKKFTIK
ncbi:MAG: VCBS repeat-containing protein [Bacteroidales bacterium]|nr:MAG: VCBS repeat-containing protein [Bacteroidales bacterium]